MDQVEKIPGTADPAEPVANPVFERIIGAAFAAFTEQSYAKVSMLEIATRAKMSKRDLYAHFPSKQAVLAACIRTRAARMQPAGDRPPLRSRRMLAATLQAFAQRLLTELATPAVIAMFRLAIAEAVDAPEVAQALEESGRAATRRLLTGILAEAQSSGLLPAGDASGMASQFLALVWEDMLVRLLLGLASPPDRREAERRATHAVDAFMTLHAGPKMRQRAGDAPASN